MPTQSTRARATSAQNAGRQQNAGRELFNYNLHERIGQEELATVYRATHQTLDRPVQVHILRRTDPVSTDRFQLAARLAARLSHPNLLPVIDAGHTERYGAYMVTPTMNARTLSEMLDEGPLDPLLALRVATQVAAALDYLHEQEVVHRDVQPGNILVTPQGVAYLTNLSLAASLDTPDLSGVDEADYLTPYSAPEQRLDQSANSPALDVYGLGAVLYHMLSGEVPPAPATELPALVGYDAELEGVDHVIRRMLAVQPEARFSSPGAAIAALRQALRTQIDEATEDMDEASWEPSAEWLENPLETVLGDMLDQEYLSRSRKRANELHQVRAIRRLLNRWSRKSQFRRTALGQLIQPEQIVSYNIYFYELRTLYETRTPPQPRQRPQQDHHERTATLPTPKLWQVDVPDALPFEEIKPQELTLPNSTRVFTCPECSGSATVVCATCNGQGTVERKRRIINPDNSSGEEPIPTACPDCRGYGRQKCPACEGSGNLVEELVFTWSRRARLWQNTDDIEALPVLALQRRAEPVYDAPINPYEGRWHSVAPLAELLRAAIADAGEDTRLVAAELSIRGVPITEVDYQLNDAAQTLAIIGFDNEVVGDWTLLNPERILLVALGVIVALIIVALVIRMLL